MPGTENTGYLVQLQSPEGDNIVPIVSTEGLYDENGQKVNIGTTYATKEELESLSSEVDSCFQSVSEGKSLVAAAVTDKGVTTAADASFEQIANNISSISSLPEGAEIKTETINLQGTWGIVQYATKDYATNFSLTTNNVVGILGLKATTPYNSSISSRGSVTCYISNTNILYFQYGHGMLSSDREIKQTITFVLTYVSLAGKSLNLSGSKPTSASIEFSY